MKTVKISTPDQLLKYGNRGFQRIAWIMLQNNGKYEAILETKKGNPTHYKFTK